MPTFEDFSSEGLLDDVISAALEYEGDFKETFLRLLADSADNPVFLDLLRDIADGVYIELTPGVEEELAKIGVSINDLSDILNDAMQAVGQKTINSIGFEIEFDMTSPEAIDYAGRMSARLITNVQQAVKDSIRDVVQEVLRNDMTLSQMRRFVKSRVGLLPQHMTAVTNLYNSSLPLGQRRAAELANEYANRLRNYRADMITRTEIATAQSYGQLATWQQFLRDRVIPPDTLRIWMTAQDERVCPYCGPMHLKTATVDGEWTVPLKSGGFGSVVIPTDIHPNCRCASGLTFPTGGRSEEFLAKHGLSGYELWKIKKHLAGTKFEHDQSTHAGTRKKSSEAIMPTWVGDRQPIWTTMEEHSPIKNSEGPVLQVFSNRYDAAQWLKGNLARVLGEELAANMTIEELQEAVQSFSEIEQRLRSEGSSFYFPGLADELYTKKILSAQLLVINPNSYSGVDFISFQGIREDLSGSEELERQNNVVKFALKTLEMSGYKAGGLINTPNTFLLSEDGKIVFADGSNKPSQSVLIFSEEDGSVMAEFKNAVTMESYAKIPVSRLSTYNESDSKYDNAIRNALYEAVNLEIERGLNSVGAYKVLETLSSSKELRENAVEAGITFIFGNKLIISQGNPKTVWNNGKETFIENDLASVLPQAIASGAVRGWATSSQSVASRLMARATDNLFGTSNQFDSHNPTETAITDLASPALLKTFEIIARKQYEMTQRMLQGAGIDYLYLVRGVMDSSTKGTFETQLRSLSSWSSAAKTAHDFSDGGSMLAAKIPASRVFSTPLTGLGCFDENEFVILSGSNPDEILFIPANEVNYSYQWKQEDFPELVELDEISKASAPVYVETDEDADWIKTGKADLPGVQTVEDYREYYGLTSDEQVAEHVRQVKNLPYWKGVPKKIKVGLLKSNFSKHLAGQHDQMSHGSWATGKKSGYPYTRKRLRDGYTNHRQFRIPTSETITDALFTSDDPVTDAEIEAALNDLSFEFNYAGEPYASFDAYREDYEGDPRATAQVIIEAINQDWATDVTDPGPVFFSLLAADTIGKATGIEIDTSYMPQKSREWYESIVSDPKYADAVSFFRKVAIAQYEATQKMLKDDGITELQAWRGVTVKADNQELVGENGVPFRQAFVSDRPLSSWSTDYRVARHFAPVVKERVQVLMHSLIPVEFIFSMAGGKGGVTTLGSALESELVVFGTPNEVDVFVDRMNSREDAISILVGEKRYEWGASKHTGNLTWNLVEKSKLLIDLSDEENSNWIKQKPKSLKSTEHGDGINASQ